MAHLRELTDFKVELFGLLTGNKNLMKALVNTHQMNSLALNLQDKPRDYMYKNLFPFPWIASGLEEDKKAYITIDIVNSGLVNNYYKDMAIGVYIFCHQDVVRMTDEQGSTVNRIDYISQEVDKMLNQNSHFGIGKLQFSGLKSDRMTDQIPGQCLIYQTINFDRAVPKGNRNG